MSKSEDKKAAIKIITECAKKYQKNILGRSLLFVCMDKHKHISTFELKFQAGNFMHLTGCRPCGKMSAPDFFKRCINGRLGLNDFEFSGNTTPLKMEILPQIMEKDVSAVQIGKYSGTGLLLQCDRIAGGTKACLGMKELNSGNYVPKTALKGDIRDYVTESMLILVTYSKPIKQKMYSDIVHVTKSKNVDWSSVKFPKEFDYLPKPQQME